MSAPYLGQVSIFGFNFAPRGWALCNGQLLPIAQNAALFAILGTTYGGNGVQTFALPDLRSRMPMSLGQGPGLTNRVLGQSGGEENHTLTLNELPQHTHVAQASTGAATTSSTSNNLFAMPAKVPVYRSAGANPVALNPASVASSGGGQPHSNIQPYLTANFCIALQGIFPSRN